ncbi:hypothetical protein [Sneathiella limimaris]|uniref:hypothetical protein n=1 Tax=Sneathiella limimaris TaxID=1964213 RepID=UPI00146BC35E|nr:hypothetical protein [Sneathiella limimaris]
MSDSETVVIDLKDLVQQHLDGRKGFANTKKLRKMGLEKYCEWKEGELAKQIAGRSAKL